MPYAATLARRIVPPFRPRERRFLPRPPNCLIFTSPVENLAKISNSPPIASIAFRSVLTKISERLSILETAGGEEMNEGGFDLGGAAR